MGIKLSLLVDRVWTHVKELVAGKVGETVLVRTRVHTRRGAGEGEFSSALCWLDCGVLMLQASSASWCFGSATTLCRLWSPCLTQSASKWFALPLSELTKRTEVAV